MVDLVALLQQGMAGKKTLAVELGIDPREVDYYKHAARVLGFTRGPIDRPALTQRGSELMQAVRLVQRQATIVHAIGETDVFTRLLATHRREELNKNTVVDFLKINTLLTGSTVGRRADTILAWLKFISRYDPFDIGSIAQHASAEARHAYQAYRRGEESKAHQSLKRAVAEAPLQYLGESLRLVQIEYRFPTNDRADIVFADSRNRLVAVEVEVDVGPLDISGLLQAVKYKHMLAVLYRLRVANVRAMLVARTIHSVMRDRARQYGIETHEVDASIV
ncbi:MAG: endonuclease NucS domain-containing protein [Dehalococcoidia bacterium]